MSQSIWALMIVMLGITGVALISNFGDVTTVNEQNYYLVKEVTEAAMYDAFDFAYYRQTGEIKIIEEKFVENFLRRYAESVSLNKEYTIEFYDIVEKPPKVTLLVGTASKLTVSEKDIDIVNSISAIFETK